MEIFKRHLSFNYFYGFLFLLNLLVLSHFVSYRIVAKPMIMASLIGCYITNEKKQNNGFNLAMIAALFGDAFLLFEGIDFFKIGLICFLVMQVLYTYTFYQQYVPDAKKLGLTLITLSATAGGVIYTIQDKLGELTVPIIIYAIAIVLMATSAIMRNPRLKGYRTMIVGVMLFVISDAVLALKEFGSGTPMLSYIVMITYMIAQFLIVKSQLIDSPSAT